MEGACRRAGVPLRIVSVASTAQARAALARAKPRVVVVDSIAIPVAAPLVPWIRDELGARLVALMHMPTSARGARVLLRAADRVVAVSPDLARTLARSGVPRSRLTVIPPGSDGIPHHLTRGEGRARGRGRARDRELLRVLAVANWSSPKGIATLVSAAAQVPEVRLDLVGDTGTGAYRDRVYAPSIARNQSRVAVQARSATRAGTSLTPMLTLARRQSAKLRNRLRRGLMRDCRSSRPTSRPCGRSSVMPVCSCRRGGCVRSRQRCA